MQELKKILVIDDDVFILKTIQTALEGAGYEYISAENGADGLRVIKTQNPDLVLCDRVMPSSSGFELLQTLRNENPEYKVPFIFFTSLDDPRDIISAFELGASTYLIKPVDLDKMLLTIKALLGLKIV